MAFCGHNNHQVKLAVSGNFTSTQVFESERCVAKNYILALCARLGFFWDMTCASIPLGLRP